jgi:hypothetical protein
MPAADQSGPFQDAEVLRNGGLRHAGLSRQRRDRLLALAAEALEDAAPGRIGQRSEKPVVRRIEHR